jgi:hypothetical protein
MKKFMRISLVMLCAILVTIMVNAAEKGTLRVKIIDVEQGTVLSGVPVTISSPAMMGTKVSISNPDGEAKFVNLTPALYEVKAELQGFKTMVSKGVRVSLDAEAVVHLKMETAQIEETITVNADVPEVDTSKATIAEYV